MFTQTPQALLGTANPQALEELGKKRYDEKKYLESLSEYAKASKVYLSANELNHFNRVMTAIISCIPKIIDDEQLTWAKCRTIWLNFLPTDIQNELKTIFKIQSHIINAKMYLDPYYYLRIRNQYGEQEVKKLYSKAIEEVNQAEQLLKAVDVEPHLYLDRLLYRGRAYLALKEYAKAFTDLVSYQINLAKESKTDCYVSCDCINAFFHLNDESTISYAKSELQKLKKLYEELRITGNNELLERYINLSKEDMAKELMMRESQAEGIFLFSLFRKSFTADNTTSTTTENEKNQGSYNFRID